MRQNGTSCVIPNGSSMTSTIHAIYVGLTETSERKKIPSLRIRNRLQTSMEAPP